MLLVSFFVPTISYHKFQPLPQYAITTRVMLPVSQSSNDGDESDGEPSPKNNPQLPDEPLPLFGIAHPGENGAYSVAQHAFGHILFLTFACKIFSW